MAEGEGTQLINSWFANVITPERLRSVLQAWSDATNCSTKPIWLEKESVDDNERAARLVNEPEGWRIIIEVEASLSDYSLVHECVHVILNEEGYPWGWFEHDYWLFDSTENYKGVLGAIANSLHHPEVYRRMQHVYDLDMKPYFQRVREQAIDSINSWGTSQGRPPMYTQFDIVAVLFHYFESALGPVCERYKESFRREDAVCRRIQKRTEGLHLADRGDVKKLAEAMREELARFCEEFKGYDPDRMELYAALWRGMRIDRRSAFPP
jgi:hypothetical protein